MPGERRCPRRTKAKSIQPYRTRVSKAHAEARAGRSPGPAPCGPAPCPPLTIFGCLSGSGSSSSSIWSPDPWRKSHRR